ncbi:metallophosphoesterase [Pseudomonas lini]
MFTILHISDLHRSQHDPIENAPLLGALLADQDRYFIETPPVGPPDAAIVSGDIIQGVTLNTEGYADELKRQYEVAHDFLARLADRFFSGDRSRVVIVPGNHDVCWNTARNAMTELAPDQPPVKAHAGLFHAFSDLRWNWESRTIFKVTDSEGYRRRLDAYWCFMESFYAGINLKHPLDRNRGFNLFELDNGRIVVAALESVHGNDCFCRQGAIERSVLGNCSLTIRDLPQQPILRIAAWHHSFQGPPQGDDYMDIASIHEMVGNGFRLGLHGHQHQADASAYAIHLPDELSMAISSTGSLCAGTRELPRGTNREYNLIVIDDTYTSARVHVREMTQGNHFGKCGRGVFRMDGFTKLSWQLPPSQTGGAPMDDRQFIANAVIKAEVAVHSGRPEEALILLEEIKLPLTGHARYLFIEAARATCNWAKLISFLDTPKSISEFIELFNAILMEGQVDAAKALLERAAEFNVDAGTMEGLHSKLQMRMIMGNYK